MTKLFLLILLLLLAAPMVYADEFHIAGNGDMQATGKIIGKNALNLLIINVWGYKLKIFIDPGARVEDLGGKPIKLEEFLEGHIIEVKGKTFPNRTEIFEPDLIRNLSIGQKEVVAVPPVLIPVAVAIPVASPAPTAIPAKEQEGATKVTLTRDLRLGMRGEEVSILQRFLQKNNWGIPDDGPVTGYFGGATKKALLNFQKAKGLAAVGIAGPQTRQLINSLLSK